jgi:hypothetical protein
MAAIEAMKARITAGERAAAIIADLLAQNASFSHAAVIEDVVHIFMREATLKKQALTSSGGSDSEFYALE